MISLESGKMPLGAFACPICGSTKTIPAWSATDLNWKTEGLFPYRFCKDCQTLFRPDRFSPLPGAYPPGYGSFFNPASNVIPLRIFSKANHRRARFLESALNPGTILDVGCGSGFFLAFLRSRGWQVLGLESASEHVRFAQKTLNLSEIALGTWPSPRGAYKNLDAVSMIHVIEHVMDPVASLNAVRDALREGGALLLETPNICSWPARLFKSRWMGVDAPRHTVLFSPKSLLYCLRKVGFKHVRMFTYSPSTMEWSNSVRYFLKRRYPEAIHGQSADMTDPRAEPEGVGNERAFCRGILKPIHVTERLFYRFLNGIADHMGFGCNILALGMVRC